MVRLTKMREMKDVGKIFENKLNVGKKEPSESVWEKINTSLDAERSRKKKFLYTWLVGTGLISIFLLFLVFNNEGLLQSNIPIQQDNIPIDNHSNISTEPSTERQGEENNFKEMNQNATSGVPNEIEGESNENSGIKSQMKEIGSEKESKIYGSTTKIDNKNFTVSKNYYYYDSKTGKTLVTQNKNKIDSLISKQHKSLDSVTAPKTNDLEE